MKITKPPVFRPVTIVPETPTEQQDLAALLDVYLVLSEPCRHLEHVGRMRRLAVEIRDAMKGEANA